jgi:hypothetical protein
MDMTRFIAVLESKSLYFCRADKFEDTFEGSLSELTVAARDAVGPVDFREGVIHVPFEQMPRLTAINCWSASRHESAAMWALYCRDGAGIAIRTTFESLSRAFDGCQRDIMISRVTYVDYEVQAIPDNHLLAPFLHKRRSFEHEKEVRALIQRMPDPTLPKTPSPFGSGGANVAVDLETLVESIYVSPTAPGWYSDLVREVSQRYGVSAEVRQSSLTRDPIY